jgi:peptidoglycan/LPS O-acetylase OafA/YrhL
MSAGPEQRCTELDGLRGLVALSVFFFRVASLFPTSATTAQFERSRFASCGTAAQRVIFSSSCAASFWRRRSSA